MWWDMIWAIISEQANDKLPGNLSAVGAQPIAVDWAVAAKST